MDVKAEEMNLGTTTTATLPTVTTNAEKKNKKRKKQKQSNPNGCKMPKRQKKEDHLGPPLKTLLDAPHPGKQGFIISYNKFEHSTNSLVEGAICLLNQYAQLHNADDMCKTENQYTFTQRHAGNPPLFIETNHPDPAVLVNAIFRDFNAPPEKRLCPDVAKAATWHLLVPVQMICVNEIDKIVTAGKNLLRPVLVKQTSSKPKKYKIKIHRSCSKGVPKKLRNKLTSYITSSNVGLVLDEKTPDIELVVSVTGGRCCMALLTNNEEFRGYSFTKIIRHKAFMARIEERRRMKAEMIAEEAEMDAVLEVDENNEGETCQDKAAGLERDGEL